MEMALSEEKCKTMKHKQYDPAAKVAVGEVLLMEDNEGKVQKKAKLWV